MVCSDRRADYTNRSAMREKVQIRAMGVKGWLAPNTETSRQ